jgi:hypothetical protein
LGTARDRATKRREDTVPFSVAHDVTQGKSQNRCDISDPDEIDNRSLSMRSPRNSCRAD